LGKTKERWATTRNQKILYGWTALKADDFAKLSKRGKVLKKTQQRRIVGGVTHVSELDILASTGNTLGYEEGAREGHREEAMLERDSLMFK